MTQRSGEYYNLEEEIRIHVNEENRLTKQLQVVKMQLKMLREKRNQG